MVVPAANVGLVPVETVLSSLPQPVAAKASAASPAAVRRMRGRTITGVSMG